MEKMEKVEKAEKMEKVKKLDSAVVLSLIGLPSSGKSHLATAIQKDTTFANIFTHIDIVIIRNIHIQCCGSIHIKTATKI